LIGVAGRRVIVAADSRGSATTKQRCAPLDQAASGSFVVAEPSL